MPYVYVYVWTLLYILILLPSHHLYSRARPLRPIFLPTIKKSWCWTNIIFWLILWEILLWSISIPTDYDDDFLVAFVQTCLSTTSPTNFPTVPRDEPNNEPIIPPTPAPEPMDEPTKEPTKGPSNQPTKPSGAPSISFTLSPIALTSSVVGGIAAPGLSEDILTVAEFELYTKSVPIDAEWYRWKCNRLQIGLITITAILMLSKAFNNKTFNSMN